MTARDQQAQPCLTLDSTVAEALATLHRSGQRYVVVEHRGQPVGVVGIVDLEHRTAAPHGTDATLRDAMQWHCVHVDPRADIAAMLHAFTQAAWDVTLRRHPSDTA